MNELRLFGSEARSRILVLAALLRETYPRELARLSGLSLLSVQRIVNSLEREGVIATRIVGANRMIAFNKRYFGSDDLRAFLLKYAQRDPSLGKAAAELRRRPGPPSE